MQMSKIYVSILELIIAIILGQNLLQVDDIFIPIQNIFTPRGINDAAGLILIYSFVISGWIGYHRSINENQHIGNLGNIRYGIDLAIVFLVYYLVSITNPKSDGKFGEAFMWIFPIMFLLYLIWDLVKVAEYRHHKGGKTRLARMLITVSFLIAFLVQSYSYHQALSQLVNPYPDSHYNKNYLDMGFIIYSAIFIGAYRLWKWPIRTELIEKTKNNR